MKSFIANYWGALLGLVFIILLSFVSFLAGQRSVKIPEPEVIVRVDTVRVDNPIVVEKKVISYEYIPVPSNPSFRDTVRVPDVHFETVHDTVNVVLEYSQKHYRDSLYEAWVSGVDPSLDSIQVYRKTITRTIVPPERHKLGIDLAADYSYYTKSHYNDVRVSAGLGWYTPGGLTVQGGYFLDRDGNHGPHVKLTYTIPLFK